MNFEGEKVIEDKAREKYEEYVEAGLKMFPPFKDFGIIFLAIDFIIEYIRLYQNGTEQIGA